MKKLNFHALYLLTFIFFNNCFGFSLTNNHLVKTVREHKKKVICFVVVTYLFAQFYNTNKAFEHIREQILGEEVNLTKLPKEFDTVLNSWFLSKSNKERFIKLIERYNLTEWQIQEDMKSHYKTFYKK